MSVAGDVIVKSAINKAIVLQSSMIKAPIKSAIAKTIVLQSSMKD